MRTHSWSAEVPEARLLHDEFHGIGAKFDDPERFIEVIKSRYGQILCISDQEECLVQMVRPVALKLGLPIGSSTIERPQANGRAE